MLIVDHQHEQALGNVLLTKVIQQKLFLQSEEFRIRLLRLLLGITFYLSPMAHFDIKTP